MSAIPNPSLRNGIASLGLLLSMLPCSIFSPHRPAQPQPPEPQPANGGGVTQPPAGQPGTNSVHTLNVDTSDEVPITKLAVITLQIQYSLAAGAGNVEAALNTYSDPNCTQA